MTRMNGKSSSIDIKGIERGELTPSYAATAGVETANLVHSNGTNDISTRKNDATRKNAHERVVKHVVEGYGTLAVVLMMAVLMLVILYNQSRGTWMMPTQKKHDNKQGRFLLFISIGSAPKNIERRNAMRNGFALHQVHGENRNSKNIEYYKHVFFTDETTETLSEQDEYKDVEFNVAPGGYVIALYNERGKYQLKWALENYKFDYYLRIDDDGVLCLDRLLFQLKHIDESIVSENTNLEFFWGKYWCQPGLSRADENFMLFSRHLGELLLEFFEYLPEFRDGTFALNTGMYLYLMTEKRNNDKNYNIDNTNEESVRIFDDRGQIDSQQGYVTPFMRKKYNASLIHSYRGFCSKHIWAHHVYDVKVQEAAIAGHYAGTVETNWSKEIPKIVSPQFTCGGRYSFNVARHLP